jgi:hypothetical protein
MLRLADIEGRPDEKAGLVACAPGDDLGANAVGAEQTVRPVLLGRPDGDQDRLRFREIGLDLRPGGKMKLHGTVAFPAKPLAPGPARCNRDRMAAP